MKKFMDKDFLLSTPTAQTLFHDYAAKMPIFDFHCHLSPKEIWDDVKFENITKVWLGGDHYKWRQMRTMGIEEKYITGDAPDYEKFLAWARTIPNLIGNPLYHWTHLELQRFFGIEEPLSEKTAPMIWEKANALLAQDDFSARSLIEKSNVYAVCTTDDPADTLEYHKKIKEEGKMTTKVLPAFRPDKALGIELPGYGEYIAKLAQTAGTAIDSYQKLKDVLAARIAFFDEMGCKASDHAVAYAPYAQAAPQELEAIFAKGVKGEALTTLEEDQFKTDLLVFLAKEYKQRDWAMEIHIGALRNNNRRQFEKLGSDTGFDSVNDYNYAPTLGKLLSAMEYGDNLPKTILFTLNSKDNYVLGTMIGCFQGEGYASKIQMGSGWWFFDQKTGMQDQMTCLANCGMLSKFVGMVTDSRSFLSYPRHEYFRRIMCNLIGDLVENGEYPADMEVLGQMVQDISFNNAKAYIPV